MRTPISANAAGSPQCAWRIFQRESKIAIVTHAAPKEGLMTFEDAADLDPKEFPGELDAGRWVPMTKNTWRHGRIVVNVSTLLKLYTRQNPGWSVSAGGPGAKL